MRKEMLDPVIIFLFPDAAFFRRVKKLKLTESSNNKRTKQPIKFSIN
jgi:hypothetical protein